MCLPSARVSSITRPDICVVMEKWLSHCTVTFVLCKRETESCQCSNHCKAMQYQCQCNINVNAMVQGSSPKRPPVSANQTSKLPTESLESKPSQLLVLKEACR